MVIPSIIDVYILKEKNIQNLEVINLSFVLIVETSGVYPFEMLKDVKLVNISCFFKTWP